jgi:VWFA-related protein
VIVVLRFLWLISAAASVMLQNEQAAVQQPVFRAEVSVVEVSAVVTDEAGHAVSDLTAGDFEIVEDGRVRPLVSLRRVGQPSPSGTRQVVDVAQGAEIESVVTNRGLADAPVFVLLLDDLNISPYDTQRAIRAGLGVLGAIPKEALFAVVASSGAAGALLTPTPPASRHAEQIRQFRGQLLLSGPSQRRFTPQTMPSSVSAPCGVGSSVSHSQDCADPTRAARRIQAVAAAAQILARAGSRRKVLFWLTTDMGVSPLDPEGTRRAQRAALREVLNSDVAVYPVDPRENYTTPNHEFDQRSGGSMRVGTADTQLSGQGGAVLSLDTDDMVAVTLDALARESGGRLIANTNDLGTVLAGVVRQNTATYILAYESAAPRGPGRHRIEVTVRRPNVRVYARRGYVSPDASVVPKGTNAANPVALLRTTLLGSVPQGRVGLHVQIVPRFAVGRQGSALMTVLVDPLTTGSTAVTLAIMTVDTDGQATSHPVRSIAAPVQGRPSEVSAEVPLARGRHQIRIAAATADGSATGLVLDEVEIREPGRDIIMAPPVLLDHRGGVHPTVARSFEAGHPLGFQVEVGGRPVERKLVVVRGGLLDASGREIRAVQAVLDVGARPDTVRATGVIPTDRLPAGEYVLVVEARRAGAGQVLKHAIPIRLQSEGDRSPDMQ